MKSEKIIENIIGRYPEFRNAKFEENECGWSNRVLIADNKYIFRIPRNEESARKMKIEQLILPQLATEVAVRIPEFVYNSDKNEVELFVGYEMISGVSLTNEALNTFDKEQLEAAAETIGQFLTNMHGFGDSDHLDGIESLETCQERWVDLRKVVMEKTKGVLDEAEREWVANLFHGFLDNPRHNDYRPALIHGDFTSDHILYDHKRGCIAGIIDFGDMAIGDPAFDFAGICLSYGRAFMEMVLEHYHREVDDYFIRRIDDFYLKQVPLHGLLYGIENQDKAQIEQSVLNMREFMALEG